ncbi:MAG: 1-deoxy-D-xylulose-5-phosphate reductoisomerase [Erysipelotrichaceae bacterium]|nr:1-deoxy-D-xylulose-5-phosphate reductoisomerase [Erysipelotrichaceae bacterium]
MKKIVLLGASGSIGLQTIDVVKSNLDLFEIVGISIGNNIEILEKILLEINVKNVCVKNEKDFLILKEKYKYINFYYGDEGLIHLVNLSDYDLLVNALVGFVGFKPTLTAIENKKDIALANKETLVVAGELVNKALEKNNVKLFPIDSEHSAILQCLQGNKFKEVKKMIITASGGSFRNLSRNDLKSVSIDDALNHPNWKMGAKITIDSATMMNKGFEVIEAHWLFNIDYDKIDVVLHDESIIHSMVEYIDGAIIAQIGDADMRVPIQYALSYPNRLKRNSNFSITDFKALHFKEMDYDRFPLLKLAFDVGKKKGNLPCVLNAANEVANNAFREGKITFLDIEKIVFKCVEEFEFIENIDLDILIDTDYRARKMAISIIEGEIK